STPLYIPQLAIYTLNLDHNRINSNIILILFIEQNLIQFSTQQERLIIFLILMWRKKQTKSVISHIFHFSLSFLLQQHHYKQIILLLGEYSITLIILLLFICSLHDADTGYQISNKQYISYHSQFSILVLKDPLLFTSTILLKNWMQLASPAALTWEKKFASCFELTAKLKGENKSSYFFIASFPFTSYFSLFLSIISLKSQLFHERICVFINSLISFAQMILFCYLRVGSLGKKSTDRKMGEMKIYGQIWPLLFYVGAPCFFFLKFWLNLGRRPLFFRFATPIFSLGFQGSTSPGRSDCVREECRYFWVLLIQCVGVANPSPYSFQYFLPPSTLLTDFQAKKEFFRGR
ncbi:hypothetical protein VP01_6040g1, partial [Puccinia sorghi]